VKKFALKYRNGSGTGGRPFVPFRIDKEFLHTPTKTGADQVRRFSYAENENKKSRRPKAAA